MTKVELFVNKTDLTDIAFWKQFACNKISIGTNNDVFICGCRREGGTLNYRLIGCIAILLFI